MRSLSGDVYTQIMSEALHVVWFKRDLRIRDHAPLSLAAQAGRVLPLYVFEPELWSSPDMSARHLWWVTESVRELRGALTALGQPLVIRSGDVVEVLRDILDRFGPFTLWSHEETGNAQTFERDKRVARFCRENCLPWSESRQFGVVRRLHSREGWSEQWEKLMTSPMFSPPAALERIQIELGEAPAPPSEFAPSSAHQKPGEMAGELCLRSFLTERCENYSKSISSPITAQLHGSRMSPYLAWGNISMRQVVTETRDTMSHLRSLPLTSEVAGCDRCPRLNHACIGTVTSFKSLRANLRLSFGLSYRPSTECAKGTTMKATSARGKRGAPDTLSLTRA